MKLIKLLLFVFMSITFLQCGVNCFFGTMNLPFISLSGGFNVQSNQDSAVSQSISRLIANARTLASNTRNQANNIAREIENISSGFSISFGANVSSSISDIHKPCEELIERALNLSGAIAECAQAQSEEIGMAINDTIATLIECKMEKIEEGLTIVNNLHSNCENATRIAQNTIRGLGNCLRSGNGNMFGIISPAVLSCKFRLAVNAGQQYANLGLNITRSVNDARVYLQNLKIDLAACGILAIARAAESAARIAAEIAFCFSNSTLSG